ncbi:hypothetical protein JTB14_032066 [Gonioctena quinquepunctata]|nr:hypothetical protein JTB14_032066 [Gonioctena quinquepunctata]
MSARPMDAKYKSIKNYTEHHLSMVFYNLTSVVLHDWRTYGEMRRLAHMQYGLDTVDDNLPMQTLEQGLDVLEIMRNINVFFIYDEHIKSRLIKDMRYFSEHKDELNQMYPYERAEKFNVGIRKLGLNQKGESYLDLFRNVITQIGNAMEKEEMPDLSKYAVSGLLDNLQMFLENMEEATEYFQLLVKVFVPVLRNKNNIHLKNFYIIMPPLTINFIEHSLNCKEKLNKRNKAEFTFTDDGFALGLAYIIEILNQSEQLNSLHWFHSVQKKFKNERIRIKEQIAKAGNNDNKLNQTLTLSEKKNALYEREFQLLYYSFNSARLFFQN